MLDTIPNLENWMVPVYKDWEWTAIPLRKYFYDISVFLWVKRIEHLFHMGPGINITKDKTWLKFYVDIDMLDKRYLLSRDQSWQLYQFNKHINIPKPEAIKQAPVEKIAQKSDPKIEALEKRIQELEKFVIRFSYQKDLEK